MLTARTRLRRLSPTDYNNLRLLESDPEVMRYTRARVSQTSDQTLSRMKTQLKNRHKLEPFGIWLAEEKETGVLVGWFMLMPTEEKFLELGFMLIRSQWRKGFATEIGSYLVNYTRQHAPQNGFTGLVAFTNLENTPSMHALEKIGFKDQGHIKTYDKVLQQEIEVRSYKIAF